MLGENRSYWPIFCKLSCPFQPQHLTASQLDTASVSGRGRDNSMYGQEKFLPGEATLKGGIVCLGASTEKKKTHLCVWSIFFVFRKRCKGAIFSRVKLRTRVFT